MTGPDKTRLRSGWGRWRALPLLIGAAVLTCAVAVGTSLAVAASPAPSAGGLTLRIGIVTDPQNLNPFIGYETSTQEIITLNYDYLTDFDPVTLKPRPRLATSWQESNGGKTWIFHLRKGVTWQDGVPFTAHDVAFTYTYVIKNNLSNFTSFTTFMRRVVALNDSTVEFQLSKPQANMLALMVPIVPEHIWDKVSGKAAGTTYAVKPPIIGTGPFQVVAYKPNNYVQLVANKHYWGGAPKIDGVTFEIYQNPNSLAADLKVGALDGATEIPFAYYNEFAHAKGFAVSDADPYRWVIDLGFNCYDNRASHGNPVLLDPAFRHAINYAIDKQAIAKIAYQGHARVAQTLIESDYYHNPDWHWEPPANEAYTFDLTKAGQMLTTAGYPLKNGVRVNKHGKPISLRLWTLTDNTERQVATSMIAGDLRKLGLKITYQIMDEGALSNLIWNYDGKTLAPNYDMFVWGWSGDIDPNFELSCFTASQIGGWSDCYWTDPQYERLFAAQQSELDPGKRQQIIWAMQQLMYRQSPEIFIAYPGQLSVWNTARWQGWVSVPPTGGQPFGTQYFDDTYLKVRPVSGASSAGGGAPVWWAAVAIAVVIAGGVVVWRLTRRRRVLVDEA